LCAVGGSHRANQVECMFRAIDTDQDGSVSPEELATLVHTSMRQHGWTREESEHRANDILTKCARRAHRSAAVAHPTRSRQRTLNLRESAETAELTLSALGLRGACRTLRTTL